MALEIERKFLVDLSKVDLSKAKDIKKIKQGYLVNTPEQVIRLRIIDNGCFCDNAYLTIKGATDNITRSEFEFEIDSVEALNLFSTIKEYISKTRYVFNIKGSIWELDIFHDNNEGLVIAEIELASEDQVFEKPEWILEEVSQDYRYFNNNLLKNPFINW